MRNEPSYIWPRDDFTRIPFGVYHDRELYDSEQFRIFRGPTWNYLCFEAEIPEPGDFKCVQVGDTPVVVSRDKDGALHAFVQSLRPPGLVGAPARSSATPRSTSASTTNGATTSPAT